MPNLVLQRMVDERTQRQENIDRILDRANEEDRDLTESERELITAERQRLDALEPMIVEQIEVEKTRQKAADARAGLGRSGRREAPPKPDDEGNGDEGGGEPEGHYRSFAQYARDALITKFPYIGAAVDPGVRQRAVQRHQRAVETVLTTDVPGLIRPEYISQIMQVILRDRPLVASATMRPLTSGSFQYPKITARPTVAEQTTQKTEVGVGTMTVVMQTKAAKTFLSSANFSWQTIQWSSPTRCRSGSTSVPPTMPRRPTPTWPRC